MLLNKEKSFPRGGRKPTGAARNLFKSKKNVDFSLFKKPQTKIKKKTKKPKQTSQSKSVVKPVVREPQETLTVRFVEDLKPSFIQDGMLILGIVSGVTDKIVTVSLPGGLRGAITLSNAPEYYKNLIVNSQGNSEVPGLKEVFHIGDVLPVKVLGTSESHQSLMLTCDPVVINQKLSYNSIENGFVLVGSVKSEEEHGFIIDFGIELVNAFLSHKKIESNQSLKVGQMVRCCVTQCNTSPGSCSVQLSMLKKDIQSAVIKKNSKLPIFCYIPGFQFEITFKKVLFEGVEVSYGEGESTKGFIHENHLLKKFSKADDVEIGSSTVGTLLYIKPLVNFLYFKIMPKKELDWPFKFGDIVSGKVMKVKKSGIIFKISRGEDKGKCFVPLSKLKNGQKLIQNKVDLLTLYPINKKVSKIRLENMDLMGRYYVGATDKASLTEKYFSISDLKCGEVVPCKIVGFGQTSANLEIGKSIKGVVAFTDMNDVPLKNPKSKFKIGQKVKARIQEIRPEKLLVKLTMKPSLLKKKEVLMDVKKCKKHESYFGTVCKVMDNQLIVKFFNHIHGVLPKRFTPYLDAKSLADFYFVGQVVKCSVIGNKGNDRLLLSMLLKNENSEVKVGKKYEAVVLNKTETGFFLDVLSDDNKSKGWSGFLPKALLTKHRSLVAPLFETYSPGEKLTVYCVSSSTKNVAPTFGAEEIFQDIYENKSEENLKKLKVNSVQPFLFKLRNHDKILLYTLAPGKGNFIVRVVKNDFPEDYQFMKYQLLYGKILNVRGKTIEVSTKLCDVWDTNFDVSLQLLDSYLKTMSLLVLRQKNNLKAYSGNITLGAVAEGVIEEVKTNNAIVRTKLGDLGIVEGKFEKGQEVQGKIIWIDGPEQIFYLIAQTKFLEDDITGKTCAFANDRNARAKVVFVNQEVIVLKLSAPLKGKLAFLPRRRHLNDIAETECFLQMGEKLKALITRKESMYLLAMDRKVVDLQEKLIWKKSEKKLKESVQSLKRKLNSEKMERLRKRTSESEFDDVQVVNEKLSENTKRRLSEGEPDKLPEVKEEKDVDEGELQITNAETLRLDYDDIEVKSEIDDENDQQTTTVPLNDERIVLSSSSESEDEDVVVKKDETPKAFNVDFEWEVLDNTALLSKALQKKDELSSGDEDEESKYDKKKRRRLTTTEKREKAKIEEERLRSIEERLMDTEREPETADDFDRALLSNPNSSALWLKYMAFHIQGTEIEKARAVARRALKAISFREEQEKLNVWIALLNLENMYGNEDSLNKTVTEALQVNDPYKIHLHMLTLHGQGNKFQEMEKLGNFILKKYKDLENMWHDVAAAFYSVGKVESARNVLQKALAIVPKNQHVALISKFAQLENRYGSPERAQTLYESILASFPKRVDIWSCYVDMLIKSNHIDLARQVLERATSQSLRPRKMKILFKKFIDFEETHGKPENVEKVREAAVEYVQTVGGADV